MALIEDNRNGNTKYKFINTSGNTVIDFGDKYSWVDSFLNGMARVSDGNKYGFIDKTGALIIPIKYDYANPFYDDRAYVQYGEMDVVINKNGDIVNYSWN